MNIEQLRELLRKGEVVKEAIQPPPLLAEASKAIWDKIPEAEKAEYKAELKAEGEAIAREEATLERRKTLELTTMEYRDDKSDKVYIVRLSEGNDLTTREKFYMVEASWGRRGKTLQSQVKCTSKARSTAYTEYVNLISSKVRKGYRKVS